MTDEQCYRPQVLHDRYDGEQIAHHVKTWWARLVDDAAWLQQRQAGPAYPPALRAMLRRAVMPDDVLLTEAFRHLWFSLPEARRKPWDMTAWGCVAAALAEIRQNAMTSFAAEMAAPSDKTGDQPRVSELRFQRLLQSRNLDELMQRARRCIHLLGNDAHVISVADGLLHWHREQNGYWAARPDRRLAVRWASDYYAQYNKPPKTARAS